MTTIIELHGQSVSARALIALLSGPKTATEISKQLGMKRTSDLYETLHHLRVTKPYNAIFIKEWIKPEGYNGYVPVFALNISGTNAEDAIDPRLKTENLRRKLKDVKREPTAVSAPAATSTPAPAPAASPVRSRAASRRPNPESLPVSSIFDLASRHTQ